MSDGDPRDYDNTRPEKEEPSTAQNVMYWAITAACAAYIYNVFICGCLSLN
ncbi:MAG: hypothetical protein JKY48_10600 [Flavobacteriales bacterium]|nr:hypothetical protein [Flavobacteriales bacterium]